jgi:aspartyl-tRNA(Asn)/glutamyl-tRNA(Gln) amidotransferase subunit B
MDVKIGLEIHCQLTYLNTKLFCSCPSKYHGLLPNASICPICTGQPGTLPVVNLDAVRDGLKVVMALSGRVPETIIFTRKNYFYPDLPKDFQISQYDKAGGAPIGLGGSIQLNGGSVRLRRIQLEEDPGKLSYEGSIVTARETLIDYNRSGVALLEIVTEPVLTSPSEARLLLQKLRSILEHLRVSDGSVEGAMRCDANISVGSGHRVEIKNISSFREVERALSFEITRQKSLGSHPSGVETRHWDEVRRVTVTLREKEAEEEYRYFPEPDLPPVKITSELREEIENSLPELPDRRKTRFQKEYGIPERLADVLVSSKVMADVFEQLIGKGGNPKRSASWLATVVQSYLNRENLEIESLSLPIDELASLVKLVDSGRITEIRGKHLLLESLIKKTPVSELVSRESSEKTLDAEALEEAVKTVLASHHQAVHDARSNPKAMNFLVGQVMRETKNLGDPQTVLKLIRRSLKSS